jgi:hypothetical protein
MIPSDVVIHCPGCNMRLTCRPYSWSTPNVVGRWLVPDHPASSLGGSSAVRQVIDAECYAVRITQRCVWSGSYVEQS